MRRGDGAGSRPSWWPPPPPVDGGGEGEGGVEERSWGEALSAAAAWPLRGHGRRHLPCLPGASEPPTRPNRREGPSGWLARRCGVSASDDEAIAMAMAVSRMCSEAVSAILCAGERFLVCARCACWAQVSRFFLHKQNNMWQNKKRLKPHKSSITMEDRWDATEMGSRAPAQRPAKHLQFGHRHAIRITNSDGVTIGES